jgi:hypothetical protein
MISSQMAVWSSTTTTDFAFREVVFMGTNYMLSSSATPAIA